MPGFLFLHSLFIERGRLETVWQVHPTASSVHCAHGMLGASVCETSCHASCPPELQPAAFLKKASAIVVRQHEHVHFHAVPRMASRG